MPGAVNFKGGQQNVCNYTEVGLEVGVCLDPSGRPFFLAIKVKRGDACLRLDDHTKDLLFCHQISKNHFIWWY